MAASPASHDSSDVLDVAEDAEYGGAETWEQKMIRERRMNRGTFLVAVTPGSSLARRIAYSQSSKRPVNRQPQVVCRMKKMASEEAVNKTHIFPRLINPESSFSKRYVYSVNLRGQADPLSDSMRDYVTNTSLLGTWLQKRIVREVAKEVKHKKKKVRVPLHEDSSSVEPPECSKMDTEKSKFVKYTKKKDSLPKMLRKHFQNESEVQIWEKERITREIRAKIDIKFVGLNIPTKFLHPDRQFIDEAYSWMKQNKVGESELYSLVEEHWVSPRYSRYRRDITESLLLSELHLH